MMGTNYLALSLAECYYGDDIRVRTLTGSWF